MGEDGKKFLYDGKNTFTQDFPLEHLSSIVPSWTLAADAKLLGYLHTFSKKVEQKTQKIVDSLDDVEYKMKLTTSKLNNSTNDFNTLANSQFIENKVYEDTAEVSEAKKEEAKEVVANEVLSEEKLVAKISQAALLAYDKLNNKTDCHPLFSTENLPYLIASDDFKHNFGRKRKYKNESIKSKTTQENSTSLDSSMESGKTDTSKALTNVDDDVSVKNDLEREDEEEKDDFFNAISNKNLHETSSLASLTSEQRENKFKSIFDEEDEDDMFDQDFLKPPSKQTHDAKPAQNVTEVKEKPVEKPQVDKTSDKADFMSQLSQKLKQKNLREHSRSLVKQDEEEEAEDDEQLVPETTTAKETQKSTLYKSIFDDDDDDDDFLTFNDKKKVITAPTADTTVKHTAKNTDMLNSLTTNKEVKSFFDDDDEDDEIDKNALKNNEPAKISEPITKQTSSQPSNKNILSSKLKSIFDDDEDDDDDDMFSIVKKDTTTTKTTTEAVKTATITTTNSLKPTADTTKTNQLPTNKATTDKSTKTTAANFTTNTSTTITPTTKQTKKAVFETDDDDDDFGIFKSADENSKALSKNTKAVDTKVKEVKPPITTSKLSMSESDDDDDFFSVNEKSTKSAVSALSSFKESKSKVASIFDSSGDDDDEDLFNITKKIPASKVTTNNTTTAPVSNTTTSQPANTDPVISKPPTEALDSQINIDNPSKSETADLNNVANNPPERAKTITKPNTIKTMAFSNVIKEMKNKRKNLFEDNEEKPETNITEKEPSQQPPLLQRRLQPSQKSSPSQPLKPKPPQPSQPTRFKPPPPLPSQRHKSPSKLDAPQSKPPSPPPLTLSPPPSPKFYSAQTNITNSLANASDLDDFLSSDHKPTTLDHNIVKARPRMNHKRPMKKQNMHTKSMPQGANIINNNSNDVSKEFSKDQSATTQSIVLPPSTVDTTTAVKDPIINDGLSLDDVVYSDSEDVTRSITNLQKDAADGLFNDVSEPPKAELTRGKDLLDFFDSDVDEVKTSKNIPAVSMKKNEKFKNIFDSDSSDDNITEEITSTENQNKTIEHIPNEDVTKTIESTTDKGLYGDTKSPFSEGPPPLNDDGADLSGGDKDIFKTYDTPPLSREKSVESDQWEGTVEGVHLPTGYNDIAFNEKPSGYNDENIDFNNVDKPTEVSDDEDDDYIFAKTSESIDNKSGSHGLGSSGEGTNKINIEGDADVPFKTASVVEVVDKDKNEFKSIRKDDNASKMVGGMMDFDEDDDDEDEDIFKVLATPKESSISKKTIKDIFDDDSEDDIITNNNNNNNINQNNNILKNNITNKNENIFSKVDNSLKSIKRKEKNVRNIFDSEDDSDDDDFIFSKATNNFHNIKDKEDIFSSTTSTLAAQNHKTDLKGTKTKTIVDDPLNIFK